MDDSLDFELNGRETEGRLEEEKNIGEGITYVM
jgi:hypothetical protein